MIWTVPPRIRFLRGLACSGSVIRIIAEKRPLLYIGGPGFIMSLVEVFFGMRLLQVYNQTRFFSLAYAMLVAIFSILGVLGLFMGLMLNAISRLRARDGVVDEGVCYSRHYIRDGKYESCYNRM